MADRKQGAGWSSGSSEAVHKAHWHKEEIGKMLWGNCTCCVNSWLLCFGCTEHSKPRFTQDT